MRWKQKHFVEIQKKKNTISLIQTNWEAERSLLEDCIKKVVHWQFGCSQQAERCTFKGSRQPLWIEARPAKTHWAILGSISDPSSFYNRQNTSTLLRTDTPTFRYASCITRCRTFSVQLDLKTWVNKQSFSNFPLKTFKLTKDF